MLGVDPASVGFIRSCHRQPIQILGGLVNATRTDLGPLRAPPATLGSTPGMWGVIAQAQTRRPR
jgi:hypothetical protein